MSESIQFNSAGSGSRIQGRCRCGVCGESDNGDGGGHNGGDDQRNDGGDEKDWATCLEQKQIGWWRVCRTCNWTRNRKSNMGTEGYTWAKIAPQRKAVAGKDQNFWL